MRRRTRRPSDALRAVEEASLGPSALASANAIEQMLAASALQAKRLELDAARLDYQQSLQREAERRAALNAQFDEMLNRASVADLGRAMMDQRQWHPRKRVDRSRLESRRVVFPGYGRYGGVYKWHLRERAIETFPHELRRAYARAGLKPLLKRDLPYCVKRSVRREVLFAHRLTKKGAGAKWRKRTEWSNEPCR